jgi:predicted ribosomally synthesized peptide with SipW-like signal peptide
MAQAKSTTKKGTSTTRPRSTQKRTSAPKSEPVVATQAVQAETPQAKKKSRRTGFKLALTLALMAVLGGAAGLGTWSAFSSTTENTGNTFAAGTVIISDNDGGGTSPMLSFANASPGTSDTSCISVTYTGSLASSVRLFGTTGGTGLDQYLNLVVTRGSGAARPPRSSAWCGSRS